MDFHEQLPKLPKDAKRYPFGDPRCACNNGEDCWVDPKDPLYACYGIEWCSQGTSGDVGCEGEKMSYYEQFDKTALIGIIKHQQIQIEELTFAKVHLEAQLLRERECHKLVAQALSPVDDPNPAICKLYGGAESDD